MELYLIRHGETYPPTLKYYDNEKCTMNPPLTLNGEEQAKRLSKRLQTIYFDHIYCSDLDRAIQTATIIKGDRDTEITVLKAFREVDMGDIHLNSWNKYPNEYAQWVTHKEDMPYPNGENGKDVWCRCSSEIQSILEKAYERVAIVCHGGTIRSIVSGILELPQQRRFYLGFPLENCSISILIHNDNFIIHSFNDYAHLIDQCFFE